MPSFDLLHQVELFMRTGQFPVDASNSSKKVTKAASKKFILKGGCLFRKYRGRLLRVVRSYEEVRDIMIRYHDNNNHCGRLRMVKDIMSMYYWVGVTDMVKNWIRACSVCRTRPPPEPHEALVQFCLAYGCDASSFSCPNLSFHKFPKQAERRRVWLAVAQRDEGSLRSTSCLCSRHFQQSCFILTEEGQPVLSPDAVPTIVPVGVQEDEVPVPSDVDFLHSNTLEDLLSSAVAAEATNASELNSKHTKAPVELQEHQYSLPAPDPDPRTIQVVRVHQERKTVLEPSFATYNQIARYLSHRILPQQGKRTRGSLRRMAKRFGLIDGVLMYTRVSPPVTVPRSREEVNSILKQFHDNRGHYSLGTCQKEISKLYYWSTMSRDLARWINSCRLCLSRTKRKWLRCSISNCTNCCGPVERGLGLTFHNFPFNNAPLLTQWLKATGRQHWHPRLWSSVCSLHFTEDCFDRGGEKVTLQPDAVPTLLVHSDAATQPGAAEETSNQAFFAKYDAVELYLCKRTYPPGLTYVEKNTFRRFCKKFAIKDEQLHLVKGDRVCLVLRNRQQVEVALKDYHDELNHLDVNKCLRLLNERYFWKTMKSDVVQWINSCSLCSRKRKKKPEPKPAASETQLEALRPPLIHNHSNHERDDEETDVCDEDSGGDGNDGGEGEGIDERQQPAMSSGDRAMETVESQEPEASPNPQPRIPILIHLKPRTAIILRTPNTLTVTRMRSANRSEVQSSSDVQPESPNQGNPQQETKTGLSDGRARTQTYVEPSTESQPPAEVTEEPQTLHQPPQETTQPLGQSWGSKTPTRSHITTHGGAQQPVKGKRNLELVSPAKRNPSFGLEPVVAPSNKPWPVFTIAGSTLTQTSKQPPAVDSPGPCQRPRRTEARVVVQQCSRAKVQIKPALDGADAQWAEIEDGMVVYVCFFNGATEDVTSEMANSLMSTKLFRQGSRSPVSVLDLPGSVLFIPQESLQGELGPRKKMQYKRGCETWWAAQLFTNLVSACRELMSASEKCTKAGMKVEQGVYGQRQEIVLNSVEPLTHLLEF